MLALLGAHVAGRGAEMAGALRTAADLAEAVLPELERAVEPVAEAYAGADRMYAVARGIEVATAAEVALKLTEVAYVGARALTATSLAHGPVAALDPTFPVWAVASDDATLPAPPGLSWTPYSIRLKRIRFSSATLVRRSSVAASTSFQASCSQSSDDWCTVWKRSSSRWTHSSGHFWSESSSSVLR